ncbi:hypothetical protein E4U14_000677 [Claviceps sp. LM454 group G7]|nr:hypothetical protein E4U14_000677 [Claviceps sp. LM454 group G7]
MEDWCDITVDEVMQQPLDDDGLSTPRNRNGDAVDESPEPDSQPATRELSASRSAKSSKAPRVVWDLRKTRVFLEALVSELNNGALYRTSNKTVARIEMLNRILPRMKNSFPGTDWSIASLNSKFKALESEMRKALTLINRSGNHYDDETGMIETTDEQWEEFDRKFGDKVRSIRTKGIPWVNSLMKQVWPDACPTGEGIEGSRAGKRRREEQPDEANTPDTAPPTTPTPDARVARTPSAQQSTKPKRRHRRLDQSVSQPTSFENGLRLYSVTESVDSLKRAVEICVADFGEELGAAGRQAAATYFVEHPEFLGAFLAFRTDDRRVFLISKGLMEEGAEDRGGDDQGFLDIDNLV